MSDGLPPGARVLSMGPGPLPAGSKESRPFGEGLTHAEYLVRSVYPEAHITQTLRDPNSALGRKNPGSYHVQANDTPGIIPVDVRPIRGMSFSRFVDGFKQAGLEVLEARDEVSNPSSHATGPHWHVALGDGQGLPAGAKIVRMGDGGATERAPSVSAPGAGSSARASPASPPAVKLGSGLEAPAPDGLTLGKGGDEFKRRAGTIASDKSLAPAARFKALKQLAGEAGLNIGDEDLQRVADNGLALLDLQEGPQGASLSTIRAGAPVVPTEAQSRPKPLEAGVSLDPRLRGLNDKVRGLINAGSGTTAIVAAAKRSYPDLPEAEWRALLPQISQAVQWRKETRQPYTGAINIEQNFSGTAIPTDAATREAMNRDTLEAHLPKQDLRQGGMLGQIARGEGVSTKDKLRGLADQLEHSAPDRLADEAEWAPIIGGAFALDEGSREIGKGNVLAGAGMMALGSLDFLGGGGKGQAAKAVLDAAKLREVATGADGAVDMARAGEAMRSAADEALDAGGTVTLYIEGKPRRIVGKGMVDEDGQAWGAAPILQPRPGDRARVEIELPNGAPAKRVVSSPVAAADETADGLPEGARVVRLGDGAPEAVGGLPARPVRPDEVVPIPSNRVETPDELPTSIVPLEAPQAGRAPKRPARFTEVLREKLRQESSARGLRVRIDAEDAIDKGVPAELIYASPTVADKSKLRLLQPSVFGTRYGAMTGRQQQLRSLDMDDLDPVEWGFDNLAGGQLDPEDIGGLLRRDLEGDATALQRGGAYDEWMAHQAKAEEAAEFAGRYGDEPPVERRGEPVSPADLDALTPPLSAYEDAPRLVGKVGNLNLERVEKPEDVTRLVQRIADMVRVDNKALVRVGNEELKALASELAVTPERILKWKQGNIPSAAELYATRVIVHQGRQKIVALAKAARGASDEEIARFHNMVAAQSQIERQLAGMAAQTGRALQQFNMIAKAGDLRDQAIKAYLKGAGDRETVEEMAEKLIDLAEDPAAAGRFIRDAGRVRKRDMLNELWINSLLSGPRTHIVNGVSNAFIALWTLPEQALGASIGRLLGTTDRAYVQEVGYRAAGLIQGAREGLALAKHAFKTGEPADAVSKVEATNYHAIPGKLGEVIRLPTRALTAADEFFKSVNRRAATNAMAYRRAMTEARTTEERAARFAELRDNPDEAIRKFADEEARYLTFQKPLGKVGRSIQTAVNEAPLAKLVIPFIRTPINIIKFAGERSPFALIPGTPVFKTIRAGGQKRDEAMAKIILGSGLSAAAVVYALDGRLSGGGPADMGERAALKNSGWQEYSMRVGDRWVSYQRFEPLSMLIGVAADFAEVGRFATEDEADSIAMALVESVAKNVTSKTWLSGASDFFDALSDPERHAASWASRLAASGAVPAIVAHAAGAMDPEMREARTLLDKIKQRVPGMSRNIEARRNVWGEEMKKGDSFGPDFLSPIYTSKADASPLMQEVARLKAPLSMPQRTITVDGKRVELTPEQYSYFVQLSGKPAKKYFEEMIDTRRWKRMDDEHRREFMKKKLEGFRATARGQLRDMFPELQSAKKAQRVKARVKDGDTFAVDIRLLGTDAFEVKQQCQKPDGSCTACGQGARQFMGQMFEGVEGKKGRNGLKVSFTGDTTYGRPVATASIDGKDIGEEMIRHGWAVAEPKYLSGDPDRLRRYTAAEAEARQAGRGAFGFKFNTPEEYRRGRRLQCEFAGRR